MKKLIISIITIIIFCVGLFAVEYAKSNTLLIKVFGYSTLLVSSSSMYPTLSVGDVIIIKEYENYDVGDIVTFKEDNEYLITHRIIKKLNKEGTSFVSKGDYNNTNDENVLEKKNIEGKLIYNSKLLRFMNRYKIFLILIVCLILLFI